MLLAVKNSRNHPDEMFSLIRRRLSFLLIFFSLLIVAGAQPDWSLTACLLASCIGYALFWQGIIQLRSKKGRFFCSVLWFMTIQAMQLSWFASDHYVGIYIYPFLFILLLALGLQFALITLLVDKEMKILNILGISGLWVLLEWGRLFVLSGFSWNPIGLSLSGPLYSRQLASVIGVYGLSFWVIFTNLLALKMLTSPQRGRIILWSMAAAMPYFFGFLQVSFHTHLMQRYSPPPLSALLVQTSIYPEQKIRSSPFYQWRRILSFLLPYVDQSVDLIVLPEAALPYAARMPLYPIEGVKETFQAYFGKGHPLPETTDDKVDNSYWARALANLFDADVVIGLEDFDYHEDSSIRKVYNTAFLFPPFSNEWKRYEKRVLVPMGEYIPFNWCKKILSKYGIKDSYEKGREAKIFATHKVKAAASICYEETYGHLMRESRQKGADLLINLSNDVWYPSSRLPMVHYLHGRLRAVEAGVPMLRACNTGVTCGIDSMGRLVKMLSYEKPRAPSPAEALYLSLPLYNYPTFYVYYGDMPVVILSAGSLLAMGLMRRKRFAVNKLNITPLRKNEN